MCPKAVFYFIYKIHINIRTYRLSIYCSFFTSLTSREHQQYTNINITIQPWEKLSIPVFSIYLFFCFFHLLSFVFICMFSSKQNPSCGAFQFKPFLHLLFCLHESDGYGMLNVFLFIFALCYSDV